MGVLLMITLFDPGLTHVFSGGLLSFHFPPVKNTCGFPLPGLSLELSLDLLKDGGSLDSLGVY